jgi:hypothetical protein
MWTPLVYWVRGFCLFSLSVWLIITKAENHLHFVVIGFVFTALFVLGSLDFYKAMSIDHDE